MEVLDDDIGARDAPAPGPLIVGIGGTVRPSSTSETALRRALEAAEAAGARTRLFDGPALTSMPAYNPAKPDSAPVQDLLAAVSEADGLIVSSPGYHGSISGLVKNALDTLEGLREDRRPYLHGRAVGLIVAADGWQACGTTMVAMRSIVHAMRGWPTPLGAALNASGGLFDEAGRFRDPRDAWQVSAMAGQVVEFARRWSA